MHAARIDKGGSFLLALGLATGLAHGATLDATTNLGPTTAVIPLEAGAQNVSRNASGAYDFGDKDGNGTRDDAVAPAGLDFSSFALLTTNGTNIVLDLNGGDMTGDVSVVALDTHRTSAGQVAGSVSIQNVGHICIGKIATYNNANDQSGSGNYSPGGAITIGSAGSPAGSVRVAGLESYSGGTTYGRGLGGDIAIYATGDVRIQSGADAADIVAYGAKCFTQPNGGDVLVTHGGSFLARDIDTRGRSDNYASGGPITLTGNSGGSCTIRDVASSSPTGNGGDLTIGGYSGVRVRAIDLTTTAGNSTYGYAGHATITNIAGDIEVSGAIDLNSSYAASRDGILRLACGGHLTVTNLDLTRVRYALLDAGIASWLGGVLTGTNGAPVAGLDDIGTALRCPAGKEVRYWKKQNPALGGQTVYLAGENGVAGAGGRLRAWPLSGTVVTFK